MTDRGSGLASIARVAVAALAALAAATGCEEKEIQTTTRNLERAWDVALVCVVCEEGGAGCRGAPQADCGEDGDGALHAFIIQSTPGKLGVVDLRRKRMLDLDPREPLHSSVRVGELPNALDVAPDGGIVLVANLGDPPPDEAIDPAGRPYVTAVDPADVLPVLRAPLKRIYTPAPTAGVIFLDAESAVATLPSLGSVTLIRVVEPVELSTVDVPMPLATVPDPGADGGTTEGLPTPWSLGYDAGRDRVLVGDRNRPRLAVLVRDAGGTLVLDRIVDVPGPTAAIAVEPPGWGPAGDEPGRWIYAANADSGGVMVLDAETFALADLSTGDPLEWRSEIVVDGLVKDVLIGRVRRDELPAEPTASVLHGTFAFLITSVGDAVVVDIQDDARPECWSGAAAGEGDYVCPRHVLRSSVSPPGTPYWGAAPRLFAPAGTPVTYTDAPDPRYPRFADWGAEDSEGRDTYGVTFDENERRAVDQQWTLTYEGVVPWTNGVGGNVEADGSLSDRAMPFCDRGVLQGDRLVITQGPEPLEEDSAECLEYATQPADREAGNWRTEYVIREAYQHLLVLEPAGAAPLPREDCFPYAVKYEIRVSGQWLVTGGSTGFAHRVIEDAGTGECRSDPADCAAEPDNLRCLHTGRAIEGEPFRNPYLSFTMLSGTAPTARGLTYELDARGGFVALAEDVGSLPVAGVLDLTGRTGPALLVVDSASRGLLRVSLDGFSVTGTYE